MFYRLLQSIMNELSKSQFEWKLICLFKVHIMPSILWWHSAKVDIFKDFANARFSNRIGNNIKYKEMPEQSLYIRSHFASVAQFRPVAQKFVLEEMCRPVKFFTWRKAMIRFNFHFCSVSECSICFLLKINQYVKKKREFYLRHYYAVRAFWGSDYRKNKWDFFIFSRFSSPQTFCSS